jgi:hypothetical protein
MTRLRSLTETVLRLRVRAVATLAAFALAGGAALAEDNPNTQTAELYQLQAAFHRAASVQDPLNGDSAAVVDQRIREMLSIWTEDGILRLSVGNPFDGSFAWKGDVDSNCLPPSGNPANQGTLCTFFKYVAGSFQARNKFVSLAPAYKTSFAIHGNTAGMYFECHYFNIANDATTGKPLWTQASHVKFDGQARKENGRWLLSFADAPAAGVPVP